MREMEGKVAVVTGGSRGIGRAVALELAKAGADVAVAGRSADALAAVSEEIRALGRRALSVSADVTVESDVARLFDRVAAELGVPFAVVNNSGIVDTTPVLDLTLASWSAVIATNLTGTFLCLREAGRHLLPAGRGKVVNIASNLGLIGRARFAAYCASKAGVIQLTRAVALEWAQSGVQVNAVAPGYVETDMNAELRRDVEMMRRVVSRIPAGRMGTAHEVAVAVLGLVSPGSDYLVGHTIVLDGGESIR